MFLAKLTPDLLPVLPATSSFPLGLGLSVLLVILGLRALSTEGLLGVVEADGRVLPVDVTAALPLIFDAPAGCPLATVLLEVATKGLLALLPSGLLGAFLDGIGLLLALGPPLGLLFVAPEPRDVVDWLRLGGGRLAGLVSALGLLLDVLLLRAMVGRLGAFLPPTLGLLAVFMELLLDGPGVSVSKRFLSSCILLDCGISATSSQSACSSPVD